MPSFDAVSEVDLHALTNAIDQAQRVIANRFDFKGVDAGFEQDKHQVALHAESDFQVQQMVDILRGTLIKCNIDPLAMDVGEPQASGKLVKLAVTLRNGLTTEQCKQLVKKIKESKLKVQAAIQGDQVRVTGKKRDDLQQAMAQMRDAGLEQPLQFTNFRD